MKYAPPGTPYTIHDLVDNRKIVEIHDFNIGDVFILLFHMCRTFSVRIDYPDMPDSKLKHPPFLWLPLSEKDATDKNIREDKKLRSSWRFITVDILNGEEFAFYRNATIGGFYINRVTEMFFASFPKSAN